ncbi:MAG TPA: hypothetical protein VEZ44_16330 [bacterium]|nr:hypothetical protein [bacterium]
MPQKRCKACGRKIPPVAVQHGDEFCSTDCARRHYGTVQEKRAGRPVKSSRVARVPAMGKAS